jgi:hypothetical protein
MDKRHVVCADASARAGYASQPSLGAKSGTTVLSKGLVLAASFSTRFERNLKFSWRIVMGSESASYASMLMHAKPLASQNDAGSLRRLRSANG